MKKALLVVVSAALVVWVASWFRAENAVVNATARPWPGAMGTLDSAGRRLPRVHANDASVKLTALANALPRNEAIDGYVAREIARGDLTIGAPPAVPDVSTIRELLLREPVVWERHARFAGLQHSFFDGSRKGTITNIFIEVAHPARLGTWRGGNFTGLSPSGDGDNKGDNGDTEEGGIERLIFDEWLQRCEEKQQSG